MIQTLAFSREVTARAPRTSTDQGRNEAAHIGQRF